MIDITFVLFSVTLLFALFIGFRSLFSLKVCALCAAVFLTWITLLAFSYSGSSIDPILIGMLMGGSIVGVMYVLERKLPEPLQIFKLPFFLTLFSVAYFVLLQKFTFKVVAVLGLLWVAATLVYVGRNTNRLKTFGEKIIECCKNW